MDQGTGASGATAGRGASVPRGELREPVVERHHTAVIAPSKIAAIATLDEEHRVLVVLRDIEELSIEEICEITGIPDGTVKSRLHRARAALRKKLQRHLS